MISLITMIRFAALMLGSLYLATSPLVALAERFVLENPHDSVVGELRYTHARKDDTLIDVAREFDLGYDQIVSANPGINRWIPGDGTRVTLPHSYILPGATRKGIVLNIADLRLYFYPTPRKGFSQEVYTYPVSIGRMDWKTPLGITRVTSKERDPAWRPPKSIRIEHARDGDPLPEVIPGGSPDNPLGRFALRLGIPTYLIHGVDERKAFGIGMRVTHGCIRMYPEDIEHLFGLVSVNTPLLLADEPIKLGQRDGRIFLSVHQPLDEREDEEAPPLPRVSEAAVFNYLRAHIGPNASYDPELVARIAEEGDGIPYEIGRGHLPIPKGAQTTAQAQTQAPKPDRPRKALDIEYEEALAKYLKDTPAPKSASKSSEERGSDSRSKERPSLQRDAREVPRRTPIAATNSDEDDRVRRYLEERY
jgi:L,D-transpeptidase ErfK/SrfK